MLYGGVLGEKLADYMAEEGGLITLEDLKSYAIEERYKGPVAGCPTLGTHTQPANPPTPLPESATSTILSDQRRSGRGTVSGSRF